VAAEHHDHRALVPGGGRYRVHHPQEIPSYQNIWKRFQERGEAAVGSWRRCKFGGGNFVGAPLDWYGADPREIDFRDRLGRRAFGLRPYPF